MSNIFSDSFRLQFRAMKILTAQQMREMDRLTVEQCGIPYAILMETAGAKVVEAIIEEYGSVEGKLFAIYCGKGNNGGDGAVIARLLWIKKAYVKVFLFGKIEETSGEARTNFSAVQKISRPESQSSFTFKKLYFEEFTDVFPSQFTFKKTKRESSDRFFPDFIIDALLGTGISRPVEGLFLQAIKGINEARVWHQHKAIVISVDIPSGLPSDQASPIGHHVKADMTVTFTAPKWGNVLAPNCHANGKLIVAPIGTPDDLIEEESCSSLELVEQKEISKYLQHSQRHATAHKNAVGDVLLIAGSLGKTGAAALSAAAIMRAGAGLVTVATSASAQSLLINQIIPEVMTEVLPETANGTISHSAVELALTLASQKTVVAIGPGLSSSDESTRQFVREFVARRTCPIVIDADGLNALAPWPEELKGTAKLPIIITPHPGEMARLTGKSNPEIVADTVNIARDFAQHHHVITIIKGSRSIIAAPYGIDENGFQFVDVFINPTGNAGMATAGSGDVLTGIIAGLLAQCPQDNPDEIFIGSAARNAALAGVYLHGCAGDFAAQKLGMRSMIASDITHHISDAIKMLEREQ